MCVCVWVWKHKPTGSWCLSVSCVHSDATWCFSQSDSKHTAFHKVHQHQLIIFTFGYVDDVLSTQQTQHEFQNLTPLPPNKLQVLLIGQRAKDADPGFGSGAWKHPGVVQKLLLQHGISVADPGGPGGPGPFAPKISSKSCSFQAIWREKPLFWAIFGLRAPPWGQKSTGPPDQNPGFAPGFDRDQPQSKVELVKNWTKAPLRWNLKRCFLLNSQFDSQLQEPILNLANCRGAKVHPPEQTRPAPECVLLSLIRKNLHDYHGPHPQPHFPAYLVHCHIHRLQRPVPLLPGQGHPFTCHLAIQIPDLKRSRRCVQVVDEIVSTKDRLSSHCTFHYNFPSSTLQQDGHPRSFFLSCSLYPHWRGKFEHPRRPNFARLTSCLFSLEATGNTILPPEELLVVNGDPCWFPSIRHNGPSLTLCVTALTRKKPYS